MLVRGCFSGDDSAYYGSAGTLARASMWLVGPLAAVMFPKIVHAKAKAEKSDLMGVVLLGTVILAAGGAIGLWVLGPWVVGFMFGQDYVQPDSVLLPWYAWAVVPLSVANVLLNNLLARATVQSGARALCSGRRLRACAQPFPRHAGDGHQDAGRRQLGAAGHLRVVHVGGEEV